MPEESSHDEFVEIRARTDSIASAIFLLAGGALSISIGVLLDLKAEGKLPQCAITTVESSWAFLVGSVIAFVVLKCHLVLQSFTLHWKPNFYELHINKSNAFGFILGLSGATLFIVGIVQLVIAAKQVLNA